MNTQPLIILSLWILSLFGGPRIYYYGDVDPEAGKRVDFVLDSMLSKKPEYRFYLILDGVKVIVYNEKIIGISEVLKEYCPDEKQSGDIYGRYCPSSKTIIVWQGDLFREWGCGQFTVHEIAHSLEHQIMMERLHRFEEELDGLFEASTLNNTWPGSYAMSSKGEFWATAVMANFGVGWDEEIGVVEVSQVPEGMRGLVDDFFGGTNWIAACPE